MPSSENLFTLDPLKTSLTKPTTDVKVQGPANRSVENSQLLQGLQTFGNAVGSLAEVKKQEQLTADMRLATNAALKGEAEPIGIFGRASDEFERIVEANAITKSLRDMNQFLDGEGGSNLVNAGGAYSENVAAADKFFDTLYDQGKDFSRNPRMQDIFNQKVEEQRNKTKLEIALVNRDRNRSQVIQRIGNAIEATVDASKDIYSGGVESDSSDIEGTDEYPILFSLDSNITRELHNTLASDTVALNMGIELPEAKRLVLQMFLQNETVIAQPSLADKLMASEYSPGVTYEALFSKGLLPSNTDKDAADIVKMRNIQLQASFNHQKALNAQDKAEAEARTKFGKSAVTQILSENGSSENAYATGAQFGLSKGEVNTLVTAHNKFKGNLKLGINTPQGRALKREIENGQHLTEEDITLALFERGLKDEAIFKALVSIEKTQTKSAQTAYDSEIKLIKEKAFQLLKGALNKTSAKVVKDADGNYDFSAMMSLIAGGTQGLDSNEVQDVILRLQRLQNDYEYRSNEAAREVARSDTFDRADVTKFGDDYNKAVSLFISDLEKNIISKTQVRDARKKEETDKKAAEASAIAGAKLKEPRVLPKPTVKEQVEEQQEILKDPAQAIRKQIESYEAGYIPYDMSFLKEMLSGEPPPKSSKEAKEKSVVDRPISESEQVYLKNLEQKKTEEQAVPTAPPEEYVSKTGLGPVVDAIDAGFDKVGDIFREITLQKGLDLFFDIASSGDYSRGGSSSDPLDNLSPTDTAEVPAGGGSEAFDPEGEGFDMATALDNGMKRDETGHMGSVVPTSPQQVEELGLPQDSFMLLKGKNHSTFPLAVDAERDRGFKVIKKGDRFFSVPQSFQEEQLVGKGLSEPGPTPIPKGSHVVQRGETLSSIAQTFDTTVDEIVKLNNITDPQKIQVGARLKVRAKQIATKTTEDIKKIRLENKIKDINNSRVLSPENKLNSIRELHRKAFKLKNTEESQLEDSLKVERANKDTKDDNFLTANNIEEISTSSKKAANILASNESDGYKVKSILQMLEVRPDTTNTFKQLPADKLGVVTAGPGITAKEATRVLKETFGKDDILTDEQVKTVLAVTYKEAKAEIEGIAKESKYFLSDNQKIILAVLRHNVGPLKGPKVGKGGVPKAIKALIAGDINLAKEEMFSKAKGPNKVGTGFVRGLYKKNLILLKLFENN